MARPRKRYTIYDVMEANGVFDSNPANIDAVDPVDGISMYKKAEFPRMVYHPDGLEKVTRQPVPQATPLGPIMVGKETELMYKIVKDEAELEKARANGWHLTPRQAMEARAKITGEILPELSPIEVEQHKVLDEFDRMKNENEELKAQIAALMAAQSAPKSEPSKETPAKK